MLYRKQIDQITWDDVETFCQQGIAEGAYLDYKANFPDNLANTIAAMANTLGGIILIGVKEDKENKPVVPVQGIPFEKGLSERVMNIILTNITPPVFPEIQVTDVKEQKTIVLIRIAQSHQSPHAIADNTRVYLRTGNRNNPEALATVDEIGWLSDHRAKSEELRERLYLKANERFKSLCAPLNFRDFSIISRGLLTLAISPLYPKKIFMNPPALKNICHDLKVWDNSGVRGSNNTFPLPDADRSRLVQDGIVLNDTDVRPNLVSTCHTELNCFGLYMFKCKLPRPFKMPNSNETRSIVYAHDIFWLLDEMLDSTFKFYEQLGYWGTLLFKMHLENIDGCFLSTATRQGDHLVSPDADIKFENIMLVKDMKENKPEIILKAAQQIGWSFNWPITAETMTKFYQESK